MVVDIRGLVRDKLKLDFQALLRVVVLLEGLASGACM